MKYFELLILLLFYSCLFNTKNEQSNSAKLKAGHYDLIYSSQNFTGLKPGNHFLKIINPDSGYFQTEISSNDEPCYLIQLQFKYTISSEGLHCKNVSFYERLACDAPITFSVHGKERTMPVLKSENDTLTLINRDTLIFLRE